MKKIFISEEKNEKNKMDGKKFIDENSKELTWWIRRKNQTMF